MPSVTVKDRMRVNHELKKLGFGGLDDPTIIEQIAFCIHNHLHFRGILMGVTSDQRAIAYAQLAPKLRFKAKPLEEYEREAKVRAEHEQHDIWDGTAYPKPFKVLGDDDGAELSHLAREAIAQNAHDHKQGRLELCCTKCLVVEVFTASKRVDATKASYEAGWRMESRNGVKKTWCPKHVRTRLTMTLLCVDCAEETRMRAWNEEDGYRDARRLGWIIGDSCQCPKCAAKLVAIN